VPVVLTSPVEGLQPGDTYTGDNEEYLLAEGYARRDADPGAVPPVTAYTGPGVSNTGPARQTDLAANPEFTDERGEIAQGSDLPQGGTNDGVVLTTRLPADPTNPSNVVV
jgi:hypothetical protein